MRLSLVACWVLMVSMMVLPAAFADAGAFDSVSEEETEPTAAADASIEVDVAPLPTPKPVWGFSATSLTDGEPEPLPWAPPGTPDTSFN